MTSIGPYNPNLLVLSRQSSAIAVDGNKAAAESDAAEVFQRNDSVTASAQATGAVAPAAETRDGAGADTAPDSEPRGDAAASQSNRSDGLTDAEQKQVDELQARDREVRAHEQVHKAVAGRYAKGGIQYTFQRGPDGRLYAVGGEVQVDTSKVPNDPEATLLKAQTLRRAALAPAEPSQQDRAVAAQMTQMAAEARQEIAAQAYEDIQSAGTPSAEEGADLGVLDQVSNSAGFSDRV